MKNFKNRFLAFGVMIMVMLTFCSTLHAQRYWNTAAGIDGSAGSYIAVKTVVPLANGDFNAGAYTVDFGGSMLSSGVYFYKLETGSFVNTKKMILLK